MDAMSEIRQVFFEECDEQLLVLDAALDPIAAGDPDVETVGAAYRAVHSIKGGAASFQLNELSAFAKIFEALLGELRAGRAEATPAFAALTRRAAGALTRHVSLARETGELTHALRAGVALTNPQGAGEPASPAAVPADEAEAFDFTPVAFDLSDILGGSGGGFRVAFRPEPSLYAHANEAARLIRDCLALGAGAAVCEAGAVPLLDRLDPEGAYLSWRIELETAAGAAEIAEIFEFVEDDCELSIEPMLGAAGPAVEEPDLDPEMAALFARLQGQDASPVHA